MALFILLDLEDDVELDHMSNVGNGMGMPKESTVWEGYNPADYKNLKISKDVADLFKYITEYLFKKKGHRNFFYLKIFEQKLTFFKVQT